MENTSVGRWACRDLGFERDHDALARPPEAPDRVQPPRVGSLVCYKNRMGDEELLERVRALRSQGHSPKAISRTLGVRPARVAPLVRRLAQEQHAAAPEPAVDCWVSAGWSEGLAVPQDRGWPDLDVGTAGHTGLTAVLVARERRNRRTVSVCGYLLDTYCLGVKDALGPWTMSSGELPGFVDTFFRPFPASVKAPIELGRHLVWGAVDYARGLGFEPHPDFRPAARNLGVLDGPSAIGCGRYGKPFYMQGPHDDAERVVRTLEEHVGEDFEFVVALDPEELSRSPA